MNITTRPPKMPELAVCRMLLPQASLHPTRRLLVAVTSAPPYIVGAGSWIQTEDALQSLYLATAHTHRRQGAASTLLNAVMERAAACGSREVSGWIDALEDGSGPAFARARGFTLTYRLSGVETDALTMEAWFGKLRSRLEVRGRIPRNCRVVPLREVPRDEIAALCAKYIASDPAVRNDLIAYHYSRGDFDSSPVLFSGTELAGFLLFHLQGSRIVVSAKVVLPKFRGGWANVLLMAALADQGFDAARHTVSFDWHQDVRDTAKLAQRFPGKLVRVSEHYSRTLEA